MKLTRLRLIGFKSFVESTDFLIEPGLTGIVGPNGCGKSNLVEALRWVMGEASHKAMRAADMDEVIFAGSANRPARNHSEVTLFLDNSDRTAPAPFNHHDALEVVRRITRDAGSTYRINGREVRARDVQILFADASTGARSPALVHQGRIGEIVQAKPAQRRRVLEEAAGIAGLHARRHEAELRLSAAEHNLARLEDVIGQLLAQAEALKRQARQASRYRAIAGALRRAEATLCYLRFTRATADVEAAARANDAALRAVAEAAASQAQAAKEQTAVAAALPQMRDGEARAAAALARLGRAREALDQEENRLKERMAELELRLAQLEQAVLREGQIVADGEANLMRLRGEEQTLETESRAAITRQHAIAERLVEAEALLHAVENSFSEVTAALAERTAKRSVLEASAREHTARARRLEQEMAKIEGELASLNTQEQAAPAVVALGAAAEQAEREVVEAEAAIGKAEAALSAARQAFDQEKSGFELIERRLHRLEAEARALHKVLDLEAQKLWPPVIDLISVESGYEAALAAALGDELQAPIDRTAPMRWAGATIAPEDPELPAQATPLANFIHAPEALARRLKQIGLVSRTDAAQLTAQLKPGQRLVSVEGDLWRWDGFAAAANAPTAAARRLAQRNRLTALQSELAAARADAAAARSSVESAEASLKQAVAAEAQSRSRRRELQARRDAAREQSAAAEREAIRRAAKRQTLIEAKARLASSSAEALEDAKKANAALAALPAAESLEAELARLRSEVAERRNDVAEVRGEAQGLAQQLQIWRGRLEAIAAERREWQARTQGAHQQIAALRASAETASAERATLNEVPQALAAKRQALISEIQVAERHRQAAADTLAAAESALKDADQRARSALDGLAAAREEAARAAERLDNLSRRVDDITHEIQELLEVVPEALASIANIAPGTELPAAASVEAEIDKLRRDRERLGAVNLRAEQELQELEAQCTALTRERDDLSEAIKRLRQGIQSLNREARERLTQSFALVNEHFTALFTKLFGGGTAQLQLVESPDPLEAGLDILAKPPGKKLQTLLLLSGGEQALTALALIFAVFLTNPAPICVLDEVDAPLDDHNVDRFCDLLDEMTRLTDTRYIIITHNPITMARMNRLFGVTMAERGVSQLVSVSLESAEKLRQAS